MRDANHNSKQHRSLARRVGALVGALLALGLLAAGPAAAVNYEQVGVFSGSASLPAEKGVFPEEVQLGGVGGMAVNLTGAGGVPAGTIYAAVKPTSGPVRVVRFNPDRSFSERWNVHGPSELCGPGAPSPSCPANPEGQVSGFRDVDVDQTTGNVYVLDSFTVSPGISTVNVFNADGSEVISRFGMLSSQTPVPSTASTPDLVHNSDPAGGIAVNSAGEVYVYDNDGSTDNFYHRLMAFKPKVAGKYDEYEYAGQDHDIAAGFAGETEYPTRPVLDSAGHIYTATEETIEEWDPTQPKAGPICKFELKTGGITTITVNPTNGEVFYYSYKRIGGKKKLHQLSPCQGGKFEEPHPAGIEVEPERSELYGLAFDPNRRFSPDREPGVIYAAAGAPIPSNGGAGQPGASALGYVFAPVVEEIPPEVVSESVSRVGTTGAQLEAQINPKGSETTYAFQYLSEAAYEEAGESFTGAIEAPLGGAKLGGGKETLGAAVTLSGLTPDTAYRFRVVATSHCSNEDPEKACEGAGEAKAFRTFGIESPGLPDGRTWELVSPPEKQGGQVVVAEPQIYSCTFNCKQGFGFRHFPMQSSPGGDAVSYEGNPFSASEGAVLENQYVARRDPKTGWHTTNLTPGSLESKSGGGYKFFDPDLNNAILEQPGGVPLSPDAVGEYADIFTQSTASPGELTPLLLGGQAFNRLPGSGGPERLRLEYAGASADLSKIFFEANDALTEASANAPAAIDGGAKKNNLYEWSEGQLRLVNVMPDNATTAPGASFGSGTLLKSGKNSNEFLTVLTHAISPDGSRVLWSDEAGQLYAREDGEVTKAIPDPGLFLAASADTTKVLLSNGHLFDLESQETTDLTEGNGGFQGTLGHSEDLSHVYFVDTKVLAAGANQQGEEAQEGKANLYSWEGGATTYVATLLPADNSVSGDWQASPAIRRAQASPHGRYLTFLSQKSLTGYDNVGPCSRNFEEIKSAPCEEAFLYDSATGKLSCASCNPSGVPPLGWSTLRLILNARGSLAQPRYLTDQGRLYFDSMDSLTLSDTNEGAEDVYQYEPDEVGGCKREIGCINLISAGRESYDSNFLAIDESGKSVFFTSRDQLVLKDHDDLMDLYVAREGPGIPSETEVARGECQGEACQPLYVAPNDPTPGSSSFEGAGNVNEKKATTKPRHKKKQKKHAKRKHAHKRAAKHNRGGAK